MKLPFCYFVHFLYFLLTFTLCFASFNPQCHDEERSFLSQFKESFVINKSASSFSRAYPPFERWELEGENSNCCLWDGIECDEETGHVIGIDLSSSYIYGSFHSNSTLFRLVHLQSLNLFDNDFNHSRIPASIGQLSALTHLNLSYSGISGQIPYEISMLYKLSVLDLSHNGDVSTAENLLKLENPNLRTLVQNLTSLEILRLTTVDISSTVPDFLANFSSLTSLVIASCGLHGNFPERIFQLPNLKRLALQFNPDLKGQLPGSNLSTSLEELWLHNIALSGDFSLISNLISLTVLDVGNCNFSGQLSPSLGNLSQLMVLDLGGNSFAGQIPSSLSNLVELQFLRLAGNLFSDATLHWVGKQTKLSQLYLGHTGMSGEIPSSLGNLTQLSKLDLTLNQLTGQLPSWIGNLTQLTLLAIQQNKLRGLVPKTFSKLKNLEFLDLAGNDLSGKVEINTFLYLRKLYFLQLSGNRWMGLTESNSTNGTTLAKLNMIGLNACNLSRFPDFLRYQDQMEILYLEYNNIHGRIPVWFLNTSIHTLLNIGIRHNFLTGFEELPTVLPWVNLQYLGMSHNMLEGSVPIPPPSVFSYHVQINAFTAITSLICNISSLQNLDLYENHLRGKLPKCFGYLSNLQVLNLNHNLFSGEIPDTYTNGSGLKMIDLSYNQLQGQVPRSLGNCLKLEFLNLANNEVNGVFPSWLGTLLELRVLNLRSNKFHGSIEEPKTNLAFSKLHIIDLSYNNLSGILPLKYISQWNTLKTVNSTPSTYMQTLHKHTIDPRFIMPDTYEYSITISNKGTARNYSMILEVFTSIDLSSNMFEGEIPEFIGDLQSIQSLNLSNNMLIGNIPWTLANITQLESLDLSGNKLSGEIPQQLAQLTFLEVFDVSHNNLTGPIPRGPQLDGFESSSFEGNLGLCGLQVLKKCESFQDLKPPPSTGDGEGDGNEGTESFFDFGWKIVTIGYGCGVVAGIIIGNYVFGLKQEWLLRTLRVAQPKRRRQRGLAFKRR